MAIVHKKGAPLFDKGATEAGKFVAIAGIAVLLGLGLDSIGQSLTGFLLFAGFMVLAGIFSKNASIAFSGSWGEHKALSGLKDKLSDDYHIFVGVKVHEKMESDFVITGPNGVFVIEVKNYTGKIEGGANDAEWILHKTGRKGGKYTKKIKNPLGQLRRNVYILSQYLKIQKTSAWIEGRTYFSNNNDWYDGCIPDKCIANMEVLAHYIRVYMPRRYLTAEQLARINTSLEKCISETPAMAKAEFEIEAARFSH